MDLDSADMLIWFLGYIACIMTWPAIRHGIIGRKAEIRLLEARIAHLREVGPHHEPPPDRLKGRRE